MGRDLLELGEDEADAAYDVVGWGFVRGERQELDGEIAGVGTEDEAAFVVVYEAEQERGAATDGVESGLMGAVGGERVVVADLSVLKSQMKQLMGIGQPGRLTQLEDRVEQHERSVQRMKGLLGAGGAVLAVFHLAIDYLRR
jgi:hypothetical protein